MASGFLRKFSGDRAKLSKILPFGSQVNVPAATLESRIPVGLLEHRYRFPLG